MLFYVNWCVQKVHNVNPHDNIVFLETQMCLDAFKAAFWLDQTVSCQLLSSKQMIHAISFKITVPNEAECRTDAMFEAQPSERLFLWSKNWPNLRENCRGNYNYSAGVQALNQLIISKWDDKV